MNEYRAILEQTRERFPAPDLPLEGVLRIRDRRRRNQRMAAGAVGLAIAIAGFLVGTRILRSEENIPVTPLPMPGGSIALSGGGHSLTMLDPRTGDSTYFVLRFGDGEYLGTLAWSPDGGNFAYTAYDCGPVRLYDLKTATISTIVPREPDRPTCQSSVAWSPDGSRIALGGYGGLELIDPDGSDRTTLIDAAQKLDVDNVTWSPDGATIAFTTPNAVYEVDADGSNLRILLKPPGSGYLRDLSWSPDGSRIAYLVNVDQTPVGGPGTHSFTPRIPQVWIVGADGSRPSMLFEGGECCGLYDRTGLSWSGDGTKIAFVAPPPQDPSASEPTSEDSAPRLYALDPNDGSVQELAGVAGDVCLCGAPEWQPAP
jgi:Tol biopolymer transport system component